MPCVNVQDELQLNSAVRFASDMDELWKQAVKDITDGAYFRIEKALGGGDGFDDQIIDWFNHGYFENEPEALAETVT